MLCGITLVSVVPLWETLLSSLRGGWRSSFWKASRFSLWRFFRSSVLKASRSSSLEFGIRNLRGQWVVASWLGTAPHPPLPPELWSSDSPLPAAPQGKSGVIFFVKR